MTDEQRNTAIIDAVLELTKNMTSREIRDVSYELEEFSEQRAKEECERDGHKVDNDVCGKPAHRFCRHCYQRETDIEQARQAKANEAADCNSALPSESLGSGSNL